MNISINKWYKIQNGGIDEGRLNCNLCKKYYYYHCNGCPIYKFTGLRFCKNTPYEKWVEHQRVYHDDLNFFRAVCSICDSIVNEEIKFLLKVKEVYCEKRN